MTVPDLTCMYCVDPAGAAGVDPRMPLSNADVKKGMKIALGVIKVDPKWFLTENTWWMCGRNASHISAIPADTCLMMT